MSLWFCSISLTTFPVYHVFLQVDLSPSTECSEHLFHPFKIAFAFELLLISYLGLVYSGGTDKMEPLEMKTKKQVVNSDETSDFPISHTNSK